MKSLFLTLFFFLLVQSGSAQRPQPAAGHTRDILEVKFSPDATKLVSYSAGDGWLILWDVKSGRLFWKTKTDFPQTTGSIKGVVVDAQDRPIANASVSAHRHTDRPASRNDRADVMADQEGRFVFSGVAPGTYTVVAFKEPQYPDSSFFGISEAYAKKAQRIMTVEEGQMIDGLVLKLDPRHSLLKIFVKDEKGDGFGSGFTFTNKSSQHSFRTGGSVDGKSERWLPPNIPFELTVEAPGHKAQKFDIELKPDEPLELEVIMVQSDPKFGTLEVHVTDGTGQP